MLLLQNDQLRAAEQSAESALEHFRQLFLAHPEPVLQVDARGQIVDCNDIAARLFGIGSLDGLHLFSASAWCPSTAVWCSTRWPMPATAAPSRCRRSRC